MMRLVQLSRTGVHRPAGHGVMLLFPPATDPRNPHLSMPSLAAVLRADGITTRMRDLDLECALEFARPKRLEEALICNR